MMLSLVYRVAIAFVAMSQLPLQDASKVDNGNYDDRVAEMTRQEQEGDVQMWCSNCGGGLVTERGGERTNDAVGN